MRGSYSLLRRALPTLPKHRKPQTVARLQGELLYIKELGKVTGDPLWILVNRLRKPGVVLPLSEALFKNQVSAEDYRQWKKVLKAADIDQAISIIAKAMPWITQITQNTQSLTRYDCIEELDKYDDEAPRHIHSLPTWLIVYIASYKVRTPAQASGALLDLVFKQLLYVPPRLRPSLLIIVALSLARYSLLAPMRRMLNIFLTLPLDNPTPHFNLLLQAIARLPRSTEAANLAIMVMDAMASREIRLASRTYHILLADRFVTLQLTKLLEAKMAQEKFTPSTAHLEAFVRVFSKHGAIHDANKYLEAVRSREIQKGNPYIPYIPNQKDDMGTPQKVNTFYMRTFGQNTFSASEYLVQLFHAARKAKNIKPITPAVYLRKGKKFMNIFDWTAAFSVAARQWKISSEALIHSFDGMSKVEFFQPTVATYTVLLRGLIMRRDYNDAERIWDRLIANRLVLDRKALGAGVKALTLAGKPMKAFRVLEEFCMRPGMLPASNAAVRQHLHPWPKEIPQRRIQVDTMTMNDFMVALLRIQRPDVIFMIWDYMEMLYNVNPDSHSLVTLCRAARLSAKLDSKSIAGNIAWMRLRSPFRKPQVDPSNREELVQTIERTLIEDHTKIAMNIWKNAPAVDGIRNVFRELIFRNWPELRNVDPPANAVRRAADGAEMSPLREVAQSIAQSLSSNSVPLQRSTPLITVSTSHASVIPTEAAFYSYIFLLGASSYQHEIPLVLVWMRALQIHPGRPTLCIALIFWAEVSLRGPLFEDWAERNERSEYGKLYRWILDWVGEDNVPKDDSIGYFLKVVARVRDSNRPPKNRLPYH
jgi:pentatricopeptide repeat protein